MLRFADSGAPDGGLIETPGVAGVDEVGRGPLAGPVVACAAILPKDFDCSGLADSKTLKPWEREEQAARIRECGAVSIAIISHSEIDRINILEASMLAMKQAIEGLRLPPSQAIIDGNRCPTGLKCQAMTMVRGDGQYASVAAASIVAKVERDRIMSEYAASYPRYGFHKHFGYGTPEHLEALRLYGPCPIHRRTFAPISEMLNQPKLAFEA